MLVQRSAKLPNGDGVLVLQAVDYSDQRLLHTMMMELTMVFRRRALSLRPVHRIKHIVENQLALGVDTQNVVDIIKAVDAPVIANRTEVETASTVHGIFLNVQAAATSTAAIANVYMAVVKNPGGNLTFSKVNVMGSDDNKKYVIHQEMIMTEKNTTAIPRTLFKGVIAIPRGYKRFGINDQLQILLYSPGVTYEICFEAIYKEFR